ncbi:MAG TPA: sensor histidine kinase [Solimonas sp.]
MIAPSVRPIRRWILLLAWWLATGLAGSAVAASPVVLDAHAAAQGRASLAGHLSAFYDESGALTLEQLRADEARYRFAPLPRHFNAGYVNRGAWWLRFPVQVEAGWGEGWWLQLIAPYVDELDVWAPRHTVDGVVMQHRAMGVQVPGSARDVVALTPILRLQPLPEATDEAVWIRVAGGRTISVSGHVWRFPALSAAIMEATIERAAVIGMVLFMAVLTGMLGGLLRDRQFLWYSTYLGVTALLFASAEGLISQWLLPESPAFSAWLYGVAMALHFLASIALAMSLLEMKAQFPRMAITYRLAGLGGVWVLAMAATGQYAAVAPELNLMRLSLSVLTIGMCAVLVWRRLPSAVPNLLGYSVYGASGLLLFVKNHGWLPYNNWTQYSFLIGIVIHMLALFMGMALRVRREERKALEVQTQALQASRAAGAELERKVAERTTALSTEIQERRKAQDRLTEALHEQRNFLAMVSHEFRTPLSIIDASAQMLVDGHAPPDQRDLRREVDKMQRATQRMVTLLDTLLADDWLDSAAMHLRPSRFDLVALLREDGESLCGLAGRELRFEPGVAVLDLVADAALLRIAIANLLENAIKYSSARQAVELGVVADGDTVQIIVRDHGPGIRAEDLGRIFERHYRSPQMQTRPGLGLGLYMVRRIAELHGGGVDAINADHGGARFRLVLPRHGKPTQE